MQKVFFVLVPIYMFIITLTTNLGTEEGIFHDHHCARWKLCESVIEVTMKIPRMSIRMIDDIRHESEVDEVMRMMIHRLCMERSTGSCHVT
mmetsp:Transcript_91014/g.178112  ORF Transcript_91014/g.178112 Transcript_91014/m.178112 type:complete len:91 (+) Transcript_91014:63-335(+)